MQHREILNRINATFQPPILYNKKVRQLDDRIINDLELVQNINNTDNVKSDTSNTETPIYNYVFNNSKNIVAQNLNQTIAKYYTTDTDYLKDTQQLLREPLLTKEIKERVREEKERNDADILDLLDELKIRDGFKEKYHYVEFEALEMLNRSSLFLLIMSVYNLISPLFTFLMPVFMLIAPFFVLLAKGIAITITEYIEVLKHLASSNSIGKLFTTNFSEVSGQDRIYIIVSACFYLFSIYQNIMVCVRFHENMKYIHNCFQKLTSYLETTTQAMKNFIERIDSYGSLDVFKTTLKDKLSRLCAFKQELSGFTDYKFYKVFVNYNKAAELGYIMQTFYKLHTDPECEHLLLYSLGFNGYLDNLEGLCENIRENKLGLCNYINQKSKAYIKNGYYGALKDGNPIKNNVSLKKNIIITGPNASGKTTVLKSTFINILLSQQYGCGFYETANLMPYDHFNCYLNIPDTCGRDSLFQAEARRCKEIIDSIHTNKTDTHFSILDELYSGTNPEEAELAASSFMKYLQTFDNSTILLTTHFSNVCKKLKKYKNTIQNCCMKTSFEGNSIKYHYVLEKGISKVKGGIFVLRELNYPLEIVDGAK
jgi:hypothetical protein